MGRSPKAREAVLDAAESLVKEQGAASLTFDKLAALSGVTRGGITYHFPTKHDLLTALVERGLAHWNASVAACTPADVECPVLAETLGQLRYAGAQDEDQKPLVAGLVAAATHDPSLLDPVREHHAQRFAARRWDERELRLYLLELVGAGLFWQELLGLHRLPRRARVRLGDLLERLAREWADGPSRRLEGRGTEA